MNKKLIFVVLIILLSRIAYPSIQGGIFNSGNDIIFKIKSDQNISGTFSGFTITLRYLSSYGVSLSNPISTFGTSLITTINSNPYVYKIYSHVAFTNIDLISNVEQEVFRITLSGGTGNGIFIIINDAITSANNGDFYVEIGGLDNTNYPVPFYAESTESPLPVSLSSFSHSVIKNDITLNWKTSKETNNKEFIVERKNVNSEGWTSSGSIQGKGNTNTITEYSFSDKNLQTGKYNYRLKQVDYNGNFEYHNLNTVVEVGVPDKFELSQNYPNPFNPTTKIDYQLPFDSKVDIRIYDVTGREVKTLVNENSKAGYYSFEFNSNQISSGIYFYRIISKSGTKDFVMTKKMMLIK